MYTSTWVKSFQRMINTDPHISPSSEHRKPKQSAQKDLRVPRVWFIENDCKLKNSGEKLQNTGITPSWTTMSSDRDSSVQCWERHHWERADIISCEPTSAFGALSTRAVDVWGRRPSSNFKDGHWSYHLSAFIKLEFCNSSNHLVFHILDIWNKLPESVITYHIGSTLI